ncbi:catalase [Choiromyces venosus 120613-1]|uniref:Catalase n=1 Tax=Choiromyces venosus 120613-1 TaxID=1336337 RepID=A0A3N4IXJ0_9PEZI|nr:catalase [Choiromyces venosus 120613-1]
MEDKSPENPLTHPTQAAASVLGAAGVDPRAEQKASFFQQRNSGPAEITAGITGVVIGGKRKDDGPYSTNNEGIPWPDPAHSKNIGGIPVASDTFLFQKQKTSNRSKTLERMAHPAGSGAFGYFECTKDMSDLTMADLYSEAGKKTPIFMRFSTVTFGKEFPNQGRNPRGFAIKHYTKDGNYDIVGLNWPIFFCRDPIQGPDVIRSQQRNPANFLLDYNATFDFLANVPESNHAGMMYFSNHGHPKGWRKMHGFGCHTFMWVNKEGQFVYIRYDITLFFTWKEAVQKCGEDPDFSERDLWKPIEKGEPVTWTAKVQIMKPEQADPESLDFGRLVLNKNPENYHRDVEQSAFSPGNMVPGIQDSPDILLQFRMFFYRDAQYHRIGVNLHQVPVNCPFMSRPYASINFGGPLRSDGNTSGNPQWVPNSFVNKFSPTPPNVVSRQGHHYSEGTSKEYDQARELYIRAMSDKVRVDLHHNTAVLLKLVEHSIIQKEYLAQCYCIKPEYARAIYDLLPPKDFDFEEVEEMAKDAPTFGKEKRFIPFEESHRLVGKPAIIPTYQT